MKKTNYQQILVDIMQFKASRLDPEDQETYFSSADEEALLELPDIDAEETVSDIGLTMHMYTRAATKEAVASGIETCPFCINFQSCSGCPYSENHGACWTNDSDLRKLERKYGDSFTEVTAEEFTTILKENTTVETL